jgi:hypothetical protein
VKPLTEFFNHRGLKDGKTSACKICMTVRKVDWERKNPDKVRAIKKNSNLRRNYGTTLAEFNRLYLVQKGLCAICSSPETDSTRSLSLDHCHKTKRIRALLCAQCNTGLGKFKDSVYNLESAIKYLKEHST